VALSNLSTGTGIVEDIVGQLAQAAFAGDDAKPARTPITVPVATLENYCGVYEVRPGTQVTFRLVDGKFTAQPTGQQAMPVFAETETKFFFATVNTEVEFVRGDRGGVTHLMMKRDGRSRKATRISD
jgi:hypothetical protein